MQKAHLNLIKYALAQGCTISVWDGEEWQVKRSTSYKAIKEAAESVDESQLRIRDSEDNIVGWALVIPDCTFEPEEYVVDYSCTLFMEQWELQYSATA
jgi:hypothetical protein